MMNSTIYSIFFTQAVMIIFVSKEEQNLLIKRPKLEHKMCTTKPTSHSKDMTRKQK